MVKVMSIKMHDFLHSKERITPDCCSDGFNLVRSEISSRGEGSSHFRIFIPGPVLHLILSWLLSHNWEQKGHRIPMTKLGASASSSVSFSWTSSSLLEELFSVSANKEKTLVLSYNNHCVTVS